MHHRYRSGNDCKLQKSNSNWVNWVHFWKEYIDWFTWKSQMWPPRNFRLCHHGILPLKRGRLLCSSCWNFWIHSHWPKLVLCSSLWWDCDPRLRNAMGFLCPSHIFQPWDPIQVVFTKSRNEVLSKQNSELPKWRKGLPCRSNGKESACKAGDLG